MKRPRQILNREGNPVTELFETVTKIDGDKVIEYEECYYLDHPVDEDTGMIDRSKLSKFFTTGQINRNFRAYKTAMHGQ